MNIQNATARILAEPTPVSLWELRDALLAAGAMDNTRSLAILGEFHRFLNELVASSTSRQFSHFASLLDLGAVGGVAIQNLMDRQEDDALWQRVLAGGVSESLMVMAARQYVKAWDEELNANYESAAWVLYEEFWRLSVQHQPDLSSNQRRALISNLIAPIRENETSGIVRAAVIVHYFQLLLIASLI